MIDCRVQRSNTPDTTLVGGNEGSAIATQKSDNSRTVVAISRRVKTESPVVSMPPNHPPHRNRETMLELHSGASYAVVLHFEALCLCRNAQKNITANCVVRFSPLH
jgi:hypothetical protein